MFSSIPLSKTAREKFEKLSSAERACLDWHVTATFLDPFTRLKVIELFPSVQHGQVYEMAAVELDVVLMMLVFSPTGRMAILDFYITGDLFGAGLQLPA